MSKRCTVGKRSARLHCTSPSRQHVSLSTALMARSWQVAIGSPSRMPCANFCSNRQAASWCTSELQKLIAAPGRAAEKMLASSPPLQAATRRLLPRRRSPSAYSLNFSASTSLAMSSGASCWLVNAKTCRDCRSRRASLCPQRTTCRRPGKSMSTSRTDGFSASSQCS